MELYANNIFSPDPETAGREKAVEACKVFVKKIVALTSRRGADI